MRLGFDGRAINERGMSLALHDYAAAAQDVLGHEALIFYDPARSNPAVVDRFGATMRMVPYDGADDFRAVTEPHKLDFCYFITPGGDLGPRAAADRMGVHAVFRQFAPHGDVYAYISQWLSDWMTGGAAPAVPHIVAMPEPAGDMRARLGIPRDAFVVGRHGGYDQFNVPFAARAVEAALARRADLHFIFVNTQPFIAHERVRFLDPIIDLQEKADFIGACDAGLNAKKIGESFGLAVAEFLALGKPCFAWAGGMDQHQVRMVPRGDWLYRTRRDLVRLLCEFVPEPRDAELARAAVARYAAAPVIRRFAEVFLDGPANAATLRRGPMLRRRRAVEEKLLRLRFGAWKRL